ncbi:heparinase, partial [Maribacter sp.]|nr:heparinase [Maribacter sp.]
LILRRKNARNTTFVSIIESHGSYSPVSESAVNSKSNIASLALVHDDENYTAIRIEDANGNINMLILANKDAAAKGSHNLNIENMEYQWVGPYHYAGIK